MRRILPWGALLVAAGMTAAGCGGSSTQHGASAGASADANPALPVASEAWSDSSFHPSASKLMTVSVAPVPLTGSLAERADQGFERVFVNMQGIQLRMTPSMVRERMNGNRALVQVMNRIQTTQYTPATMTTATLKTMLTGREYADFRTAVGDPVVTFVPVQFSLERSGKDTHGMVLYRAFDMETGRLLRQCRFAAQSALAVEAAEQKVLVDLILAVEGDFSAHFVAR